MVDIVKTRTQLVHRALGVIGALEPGEAPSSEDYDTVDDLVDPLIAQLSADQVIYIDDANAIPVEFFMPLANLLGNMAGPGFGSAINEDAKIRDERTLKRMASTRPTYEVLKQQPF